MEKSALITEKPLEMLHQVQSDNGLPSVTQC